MMVAAVALAAVSAYGSIKEGQDKKNYYNQLAAQTRVETERKAIQYEFQGNQILQRTNAANAASIAKAFSGGVNAFDGSAQLVQQVTNQRGGKEFAFALSASDSARRNGLIQASLYEGAGVTAERSGYFSAAAKLGAAAMAAGGAGGAPSTPAPVTDMSTAWSPPA